MARLYPMLLFALLVLMVPVESAGYAELAKLNEVSIIVQTFDRDAKELLTLNEDDIKNQVFVFFRSKLPNLKVKESSQSSVYIAANIGKIPAHGGTAGYYGEVLLKVSRPVIIKKTGTLTYKAAVWSRSAILMGTSGGATANVRVFLDQLLTKFAADWYRVNP
ncbi:MAG: hypothetical protein V3T60_14830 [Candidatus Binatia bacterium]